MTTSYYTGICIKKSPPGVPDMAQVRDSAGNKIEIPVGEYKRRKIKPPVEELPERMLSNERNK